MPDYNSSISKQFKATPSPPPNPPSVCTDLYPAVAPVCYYDVTIDINCHTRGSVELAVTFTIRTKLQQEFSFAVENLC